MKARLLILLGLIMFTIYLMPGGIPVNAGNQGDHSQVAGSNEPFLAFKMSEYKVMGTPSTGTTSRVSVASNGTQGNGVSEEPSISADGRYVAFASASSNLVSGDNNNASDVFVHDRQTGQTSRVSVASDGTQGNHYSGHPSISADGRYVAFESYASNLVSGDTDNIGDVFVHDRQMGQTSRVSVASDGTQGNGDSESPSISADGRYIAFASAANNLAPGDTNYGWDVFVHDWQTGQTGRVSVASDGTQGNDSSGLPSISADGRYAAFYSYASNLVSGDTNDTWDIFVRDRQTGQTSRVSVASDGTQGNGESWTPSISADGRYVAFYSSASNLVSGDTNVVPDIFVHDRQTGQTNRISVSSDGMQGNAESRHPSISANGRYITFQSWASNLIPDDTNGHGDAFVYDLQMGHASRVSVASDGTQANSDAFQPSISADGRYVAFESWASTLVPGDTNGVEDIFVHDLSSGTLESDLAITSVKPIQVIEDVDLIIDKETAVKVEVHKDGAEMLNNVQISVEHNGFTHGLFYVLSLDGESLDGPYNGIDFPSGIHDAILYFFADSYAPAADGTYFVSAAVDPGNAIPESDETNNALEVTATVDSTYALDKYILEFSKSDWTGGQPDIFIEDSAEFAAAVMPIAGNDFFYRYNPAFVDDNQSYRDENNRLTDSGLNQWMASLYLTHMINAWLGSQSRPDVLAELVPGGWFADNTYRPSNTLGITGEFLPVLIMEHSTNNNAEMRVMHEIGHRFGAYTDQENYDLYPPIGSPSAPGMWVSRLEPKVNPGYIYMGSYDSGETISYWTDSYLYPTFDEVPLNVSERETNLNNGETIIVQVSANITTNVAVIGDWYYADPGFELTPVYTPTHILKYFNNSNNLIFEHQIQNQVNDADGLFFFTGSVPWVDGTKTISIEEIGGNVYGVKEVSTNAPTVSITQITLNNNVEITWAGDDQDGDNLKYILSYSIDGGNTWELIGANIEESSYIWNQELTSPVYLFKIVAGDGFHIGSDLMEVVNTSFTYLPVIVK